MSTTGSKTEGGFKDGKVRRTLHNPAGMYRAENMNTGTVYECTDLVTLVQRITEDFTRLQTTGGPVIEWNIRGVPMAPEVERLAEEVVRA